MELVQRGKSAEFEQIRNDILRRDAYDSQRQLAPLRIAVDATVIDTSDLTPEEVVHEIILTAARRLDETD